MRHFLPAAPLSVGENYIGADKHWRHLLYFFFSDKKRLIFGIDAFGFFLKAYPVYDRVPMFNFLYAFSQPVSLP